MRQRPRVAGMLSRTPPNQREAPRAQPVAIPNAGHRFGPCIALGRHCRARQDTRCACEQSVTYACCRPVSAATYASTHAVLSQASSPALCCG